MSNLKLALIPATLGLASFGQAAFCQNNKEVKPNVLWIVTDDQRADALECWNRAKYGTSENQLGYVSSPNLDKLASEGVLFMNSYCNSPVSGPSRASMHTGQYAHHNGMFNFQLKHDELDVSKPVVPEVMREAGYSATSFGKIGYYIYKYSKPMRFTYPDHYEQYVSEREIERTGYSDAQKIDSYGKTPAFKEDVWHYPDGTKRSYKLYQNEKNASAEDIKNREQIREEQKVIVRTQPWYGEIIGGESTMPTDLTQDGQITSEFCSYFDNADKSYTAITGKKMKGADTSKPQFVHLGYHFPHTPVLPSKEYRDKFKDLEYDLPDFNDAEYKKMPEQMKRWFKNSNVQDLSKQERLQMVRDYYAFCAMGDELLGKAVDSFKKYCDDNNQPYVIIFACGDNGWHLGEQGSVSKITGFIKSNEAAVIAVSSDKNKFPAGKVVKDIVEYVDMAPTIYRCAGVDITNKKFEYLDGQDLELVAKNKITPKEYALGETQLVCGHRAYLRSADFAFSMRSRKGNGNPSLTDMPNSNVKWPLECTPEEAEMGLYDLRVDPHERNNVAYDKEYQELAQWFREKLGNIVLGDDRLEVVWDEKNVYNVSSFAKGSDDKKLDIPKNLIPKVKIKKKK